MEKVKSFIKTSIMGGVVVILPLTIIAFAGTWVFRFVTNLIRPLTLLVREHYPLPELLVDGIVIGIILATCFVVGLVVRTKLGKWLYRSLEKRVLEKAPGYSLVRETVLQFLGDRVSPFASVALMQIFGNDTMVSAFVTDRHGDRTTVFVPTGPNPTSGNIYHVESRFVHPVDVSVENAMRTIISCGAGSACLVEALKKPGAGE